MDVKGKPGRESELEAQLLDANRQLLERDRETLDILAARDEELALAHAKIERRDLELERHVRDVESLNRAIAEMQATRAWRFAERLRRLHARLPFNGGRG